jgi:hypothetical protein
MVVCSAQPLNQQKTRQVRPYSGGFRYLFDSCYGNDLKGQRAKRLENSHYCKR